VNQTKSIRKITTIIMMISGSQTLESGYNDDVANPTIEEKASMYKI
jgi:hypothetical protein